MLARRESCGQRRAGAVRFRATEPPGGGRRARLGAVGWLHCRPNRHSKA